MTDYSKFVVPPQQWTLQMANEEIESLRQQLAYLQEELGNPPIDFHLLKQQLAECERERDELVAAVLAARAQFEFLHSIQEDGVVPMFGLHEEWQKKMEATLAKLGADKTEAAPTPTTNTDSELREAARAVVYNGGTPELFEAIDRLRKAL